jgi:hypothetical protein
MASSRRRLMTEEQGARPGTLLATAAALASVPYAHVQARLNTSSARRVLGVGSEPSLSVGAARDLSTLWMRGGFWYQGEYIFAPMGEAQTLVTYRIRNISGFPDRLIRTWQRAHLKSQQRVVDRFATELPGRITP